jgi:hypothetical protein
MTTLTRKTQPHGFSQQLPELSIQLAVIFHAAMDLNMRADW